MLRFIFKCYLTLSGWKAVNIVPADLKKFVMLVAPHTSSWDVFMGFAFRNVLKLGHIKFIAKDELFKPPFGFIFLKSGSIAVTRSRINNFVNEIVILYNKTEALAIALSPEGTRKKVDRLRTGFYHIARKAKLPIIMLALDFKNKEFRFSPPFYRSQNEAADLALILYYFLDVKGKNPALGLPHLARRLISKSFHLGQYCRYIGLRFENF